MTASKLFVISAVIIAGRWYDREDSHRLSRLIRRWILLATLKARQALHKPMRPSSFVSLLSGTVLGLYNLGPGRTRVVK